jgi:histone H2A
VARFLKKLKKNNPNSIVREESAVMAAGVIEYLVAELLELAGNVANDHRRKTITPRHIYLAVANDEELEPILRHVTIAQGGSLPLIHPVLLKQKQDKIVRKRKRTDDEDAVAEPKQEKRVKA